MFETKFGEMEVIYIFSGADGTGKSTIIDAFSKVKRSEGIHVNVKWLRYVSYLSKFVNVIGRLTGKSYKEKYGWGVVGYHEYSGWIGYLFIIATFIDHSVYFIYFRIRSLFFKGDVIFDRYLIDSVADLIVDTNKPNLILQLFRYHIKWLNDNCKVILLECDENIVISRRPDILDDKCYKLRVEAFMKIKNSFNLDSYDTGNKSVDDLVRCI